jgi:hypothetical protein
MPEDTGCTTWVMVSDTMLRRATSISCGSFSIWSASFLISSEKVAENSRLWRCLGSRARMRLMSGMKPMSSMRSASSSTSTSTWRQVDRLLLDVVEQPARRGDDDLDAAAQFGLLRADVDAAIDAHRAQRQVLAVGLDRLEHLHGQLARGREDQRARRVAGGRGATAGVARDAVQQRQREAGGLAGAGLGAAHDVLAGDDDRDGLALDGRGFGVAGVGDGLQQFGNEAEVGKTHGCLRVWGGRQPTTGLRKARIIHRTKTFT